MKRKFSYEEILDGIGWTAFMRKGLYQIRRPLGLAFAIFFLAERIVAVLYLDEL